MVHLLALEVNEPPPFLPFRCCCEVVLCEEGMGSSKFSNYYSRDEKYVIRLIPWPANRISGICVSRINVANFAKLGQLVKRSGNVDIY